MSTPFNISIKMSDVSISEKPANTANGVRGRTNTCEKPSTTANGVRGRTNTWEKPAATGQKFGGFGADYNAPKKSPGAAGSRQMPGRPAPNKYTPSTNSRPANRNSTPGRFTGIQKDEPVAPSFGGSASDRKDQFRQAADNEKARKERAEERKREAEEKMKQQVENQKLQQTDKKKEEEEKKKKEDEEKKKKEEEEKKKEEEEKNDEGEGESKKSEPACKRKKKKVTQRTMSISNIVMDWIQEMTKDYPGVNIKNFSSSFYDGLAFCALIHRFNKDEFDFNALSSENRRENFDLAFNTGQKVKNIPLLLYTDELLRQKKLEPRSVQTYVQWIWSVYGPESGYGPSQEEIRNATIQ